MGTAAAQITSFAESSSRLTRAILPPGTGLRMMPESMPLRIRLACRCLDVTAFEQGACIPWQVRQSEPHAGLPTLLPKLFFVGTVMLWHDFEDHRHSSHATSRCLPKSINVANDGEQTGSASCSRRGALMTLPPI
eukprot:TRINITY_DN18491_c0_g1_i1.p1 TRINITY_DN18491_c0_g1~~TRINITY_DN18491_c0_g1_i1.p1  ORF type:complete len:135 (+),score=5.50 TRINITY_DN18491_c0_g1_i1:183-587(+)